MHIYIPDPSCEDRAQLVDSFGRNMERDFNDYFSSLWESGTGLALDTGKHDLWPQTWKEIDDTGKPELEGHSNDLGRNQARYPLWDLIFLVSGAVFDRECSWSQMADTSQLEVHSTSVPDLGENLAPYTVKCGRNYTSTQKPNDLVPYTIKHDRERPRTHMDNTSQLEGHSTSATDLGENLAPYTIKCGRNYTSTRTPNDLVPYTIKHDPERRRTLMDSG